MVRARGSRNSLAQQKLAHDPSLPIYVRIAAVLRAEILAGLYPHGTALPTEAEITERFSVARLTVRRALETLALDGIVARRPGRGHGTRVNLPEPTRPDRLSIDGLVRRYQSLGMDTSVEIIALETGEAGIQGGDHLQCDPATPVISVTRRRFVSSRPFSVYTSTIPEHVAPTLKNMISGDLPVVTILESLGVRVARAEQYISAAIADGNMARLMLCHPGDPLINVRRVTFSDRDTPVEYISVFYRSTDYQYRIALKRDHDNEVSLWSITDVC
jgi:GntR family transcriptional regulator